MVVQLGLCGTWLETPKTGFLTTMLNYANAKIKKNRYAGDITMIEVCSCFYDVVSIMPNISLGFVGWLVDMILSVPVNNFSVMLGRSHRFLGITSTFWGVNVPCSRTQHGLTRVGLKPPTSGSGVRGIINHQATALPFRFCAIC